MELSLSSVIKGVFDFRLEYSFGFKVITVIETDFFIASTNSVFRRDAWMSL